MADQMTAPAKPRQAVGFAEQFKEPFSRLRGEVDRMFDDFPARWPALHLAPRFASFMPMPAVEMTETDESYKVSVEVPGIEPGDIQLEVEDDMLVLKGEKKEEREEKERDYTRSERSYGAFERRISLPQDAVVDDISANTVNGVLKIAIPRNQEATPERRKIAINATKG